MAKTDKSDEILRKLGDLAQQVSLIQAVLLELTRPAGKGGGKRTVRTMDVTMDGCEDQTIEPSDDAGDDDSDDGGGDDEGATTASKKLVRAAKPATAAKKARKTIVKKK